MPLGKPMMPLGKHVMPLGQQCYTTRSASDYDVSASDAH